MKIGKAPVHCMIDLYHFSGKISIIRKETDNTCHATRTPSTENPSGFLDGDTYMG